MKSLADFVLVFGAIVFVLVGGAGMVTGAFELRWMYPIEVLGEATTYENQQRFLKTLELSWGLAILLVRPWVFVEPRVTAAALTVFVLPPVARGVSMAVDGTPHPHFVALFVVDVLGAIVLLVRAYRVFGGYDAPGGPGRAGAGVANRP